ncbi:MAG: hypothetical protein KC420_10675 [Myxococcales bacterium]|nr:hypothetical protein [Myxococcales bacterium]MCB9700860.1 hypothetical protein [Myxococcales bacterium]
MRISYPILALLLVALPLACGDDGAATTSATSSTSGATSSSTSEGSSGSGSTAGSTSGGGSGSTGTASSSSGSSSGGSSSGGTSSSGGETSGSTGTTGVAPPTPCVDDGECVLQNDCCACDPHHVGEEPPACDLDCLQPSCDAIGLADAKAVCRFGRCTFEKTTCNPLGVTCKSLPPECAPGTVASVVDDGNGKCWTGHCVPAEACDWAPECAACDAPDLTCVAKLQKGAYVLCEPLPWDCGEGPATCACAESICLASPPHTVCHDVADGIACECPNC